jgi:choline-sulfatase
MTNRPKVIVCLTDQLRPFELGCYGGNIVPTPAIDSLAATGVRFETALSILLSGQYCRTCLGSLGNSPEPIPERKRMVDPTLAEVFRDAGYRTGLIGKWHIHVDPELLGFDTVYYPNHMHRYTGQTFYRNGGREELVEGFTVDAELAELRTWMGDHKSDPFFLYYNISQPHMPVWDAPEQFRDMFMPDHVELRANVWNDGELPYDEKWFKIYLHDYLYYQRHLPHTEQLPEGFDIKRLTAHYYGMIAWADYQLGELMRNLEDNGLADNTIVLFTSDHGDMLGSHHMFNKDVLFEESLRIPMIVRWPEGLKPRVVDSQVISLVDVMPTLLSLSGLQTPSSAQGTDCSPVVLGEADSVGENAAFVETNRNAQAAIRTLTHAYGYRQPDEGDQAWFYDITHDPLELRNLAGSGEQSSTEQELCERAERWDRETRWLGVGA